MLNPGYKLPSRKTVSASMIPQLYNAIFEKLQTQINLAKYVCLTTDCWTSINNQSFMAITAHYFIDDLQLKSICIGCDAFDDNHTSKNLSARLKQKIAEWSIANKVVAIVSDNAPNITCAIRDSNYHGIGCFAHSINLVVQNGIKDISTVVKKVKSIVEYFKRSSSALVRLNDTQKQMGMTVLKLIQDVVTRWNSTYHMLKRFLTLKEALLSTLAVLQSKIDPPTPEEWTIIELSIEILSIFHEVTEEISGEKHVTLSKILVFINAMVSSTKEFEGQSNLEEINLMIATLLSELDERFSSMIDNDLVTQAAFLDPRIKNIAFTGFSKRKYEVALDLLKKKVNRKFNNN